MVHSMFLLAASLLGVDYGWQPLPQGGLEYLIQIEPALWESVRTGTVAQSTLPPGLTDVRAYRISVGTERLPRDPPLGRTPASPSPATGSPPPATGSPLPATATPPRGSGPGLGKLPGLPDLPPLPSPSPAGGRTSPPSNPPTPAPAEKPRPDRYGTSAHTGTSAHSGTAATSNSSVPPAAPRKLAPEPATRLSAEQPMTYFQPFAKEQPTTSPPTATLPAAGSVASRPWLLLLLAGVAAGSLSWNVYLLWLLAEARSRYRRLLGRVEPAAGSSE